jgi:hypothetical protein
MNAQQWDEWTSIGQTDCAVGAMQARECDSVAEATRLLRSEDFGVEATGCAATACVPDSSTTTFIKNSEQELVNRSLVAWLQQEPWGFVRSQRQPFASAGDIFLYENPTTDVSGQIVVTRLYDNKRGDFTLQQEKLSLVSNSVPVEYYQCRDELCYVQQLRKNNRVRGRARAGEGACMLWLLRRALHARCVRRARVDGCVRCARTSLANSPSLASTRKESSSVSSSTCSEEFRGQSHVRECGISPPTDLV